MAKAGTIVVPVEVQGELMNLVPSPLRPYAKALVAAIPPVVTAWAVLQSGDIGVVTVVQFVIAVATVLGIYAVPLLHGRWASGAKTGIAALGAVLAAAAAGFGDGGAQGWIGFGSAALAAVLVEVVDNVPNSTHVVETLQQAIVATGEAISAPVKVPVPDVHEVDPEG